MKWRLIACLMLAMCMILPVATAVSADSTTRITGTVAPLLPCSDVCATDIGYYGATIVWKTNRDATSKVYYDTVSRVSIDDYRYTQEDPTLVTEHSVRLTGLSAGRTYYYRVKSEIPGNRLICIYDEYTFTTRRPTASPSPPSPPSPPPPPPPPTLQLQVIIEGEVTTYPISAEGEVLERVERTSSDGRMTIVIPEGTIVLDKDGKPLLTLTVDVDPNPNPPPPPHGAHIIVLPYDFGPPGVTFDPPLILTWQYDPADISEGVAEDDLIIAYYDEETGEWAEVPSVVDVETNTITAQVAHFTTLAIIAAPPVQYDLTISSTPGGLVTTPGEGTFTYASGTSVSLVAKPNDGYKFVNWTGNVATIANVNATSTTITMNGDYSIRANFEEIPPPPINWRLVGGIIVAVVVVGLVLFFLRRRK